MNTLSNPSELKITDMRFVDIDGAPKRCTILRIDTIPIIQEVEVIKEVNRIKDWQMILMLLGGGMVAVIGYKLIKLCRK